MSSAQFSVLIPLVSFLFQLCAALYPTQLIYEFPNGTFVENLAVRPDGSILTTLTTSPDLYLIQPLSANPNPQLIYRFAGSTSALGITEVSPDTFQVGVTNASGPGQAVPGTSKLYQVTFPRRYSSKAKISLTANIPNITAPNGLLTLNKNKILVADSVKGLIFAVDLKTGKSRVAITDSLFATTERLPVGVNGIKLQGNALYFTTSAQNLLGKVNINLKTGAALGPATKIVNGLPPAVGYDDFALRDDAAYVTSAAGNFIERVDLKRRQQTIVAGQINSTDIAEPTSAAFGRNGKENVLFVTTGGGLFFPVNGNEIVGGQLVAVKLSKKY
ncbi:MAG: hypothetical protein LQ342_007878 [Letrouitia transgressa]|nr:MAG: hypothetical protein LQ342_007878 [Letrouitia transgressa]